MSDNLLNLSDEDFLKQDPQDFEDNEQADESQEDSQQIEDGNNSDEETANVEGSEDPNSQAQEEPEEELGDEEVSQPDEDTQQEHEPFSQNDDSESLDTSKSKQSDKTEDTQETDTFDYESAYKKVTAPFKANGSMMHVTDPQDIISLKEMGANYQMKMAKMKPHLKVIKMLENNNLLDEGKLNNLIDLSKKDKQAIAKLIEDSGIDPLDIDTDEAGSYNPTNYTVTDKEYELDQALDSIKNTDTFDKTINVLTNEWDDKSKVFISDNPNTLKIINDHMANGVFDRVNGVMQQERTLGRLSGMSDYDAYRYTADMLRNNGVLIDNTRPDVSSETGNSNNNKADASKRNQKRKAAAPAKQASGSSTSSQSSDFLGLSDEEFMAKHATI